VKGEILGHKVILDILEIPEIQDPKVIRVILEILDTPD